MRCLNIILFIGLMAVMSQIHGQRQSIFVAPQVTDPEITTNLSNHFVAINQGAVQKNRLFLFFPGTGGVPFVYREITNNAADLGFHSIALTYPNDDAVNVLCGLLQTDLDCYGNVRLEIKDGTDRTTRVDVNRANSIENRLIKLLQYLNSERPGENWSRFLLNQSTIDWTKIVVSGHSQGGGHAGIIGRYHAVSRVIMYAAADYNGLLQTPANWIERPETTPDASPPDRFWGFSHQLDESVNFNNLTTRIWPAYGMPLFGDVINVDTGTAPYANTHSLTSSRACKNHHGCVAVDFRLVFENNVPVYKPVWEYLLSNAENTITIGNAEFRRNGVTVGRPHVGRTTKGYSIKLRGTGFGSSSGVYINGRMAGVTAVSEESIEALIPAGTFGAFGASKVVIIDENGGRSNTLRY